MGAVADAVRAFDKPRGADLEGKRTNALRVVRLLKDYGYSVHHVESDAPVDASTADRVVSGHLYCE